MRLKRILGLFAFIGLGIIFTSCSSTPVEEYSFQEDVNTSDGYFFSTIVIDTKDVKKIFYVGDEFTIEGLKVIANYRKMIDGEYFFASLNTFLISSTNEPSDLFFRRTNTCLPLALVKQFIMLVLPTPGAP